MARIGRSTKGAAALAIALSLLGLVPAVPAWAAPGNPLAACRVVNASTDVDYDTLQAAVAEASEEDVLRLRGVCYGHTTVETNLTIVGVRPDGAPRPSMSGNDESMVLTVSSDVTLTIRGLTIRDGNGDSCLPTTCPGGIQVLVRATLTLKDVLVRNNHAGDEGAIDVLGTLILAGKARVAGNRATNADGYAGGINVYKGAVLVMRDDSVVSGNTGGYGGGIYLRGAARLVGNAQVTGNTATMQGGGIYVEDVTGIGRPRLRLVGSASIHDNTAPADGDGGGIWQGTAIYTNVLCGTNVYDNTPEDCAGVI